MSWREELLYSLLGALTLGLICGSLGTPVVVGGALGGLWAGVVLMMSRSRP
jgi:hypothetical protein